MNGILNTARLINSSISSGVSLTLRIQLEVISTYVYVSGFFWPYCFLKARRSYEITWLTLTLVGKPSVVVSVINGFNLFSLSDELVPCHVFLVLVGYEAITGCLFLGGVAELDSFHRDEVYRSKFV